MVLLPPSECKRAPRRGAPLNPAALSFPEMDGTRRRVRSALELTSSRPDALTLLGVGESLAAQVARNVSLGVAPTAAASSVYDGVLYEALGWPTLSVGGKRRAAGRLIITSALWGALRPADRIPAYRLSMSASLVGLGPLAALWQPSLQQALGGHDGLIVDCRSGDYQAAWRPTGQQAARRVVVAVTQQVAGRRTVVSHLAKHTRGQLARFLMERPVDPATPQRLLDGLQRTIASGSLPGPLADARFELTAPPTDRSPWRLDVIRRPDLGAGPDAE